MEKEILDLRKVPLIVSEKLKLTEKESWEEVRKQYPFSLDEKAVVAKQAGKFTLLFVINKTDADKAFISFALFVLNRYRNGIFVLKRGDYREVVELREDELPQVRLAKASDDTDVQFFDEAGLMEQAEKKDSVVYESRKRLGRKLCFEVLVSFAVFLAFFAGIRAFAMDKKERLMDSIKQEKLERKAEEERKALYKKTLELQQDFENSLKEKVPSIYKQLEHIYSCCSKGDRVKSLNIEKNHFSVELYTKSAVKNLERFEKSEFFSGVKMNRLQQLDGVEFVSFTGEAKKVQHTENRYAAGEKDSLEELKVKNGFYENELKKKEEAKELKKSRNLSLFVGELEAGLKKNGLRSEYIQSRGGEKSVQIEVYFKGQSRNVLQFTEGLCVKDEELVKTLRINNQENFSGLHCVMILDTGIETDGAIKTVAEEVSFKAAEISSIFPVGTKKVSLSKTVAEKEKSVIQLERKKLKFMGEGRKGKERLIFVSDEESAEVYSLKVVEREDIASGSGIAFGTVNNGAITGNYAYVEGEKLVAVINGKNYEVKN